MYWIGQNPPFEGVGNQTLRNEEKLAKEGFL
jgi:hypothetical protein